MPEIKRSGALEGNRKSCGTSAAESVEWTGSEDIWAPDIVKVGKEYRLYCSNSSWGVRQSCIFLAVADRPEGPFEPKGVCLKLQKNFRSVYQCN